MASCTNVSPSPWQVEGMIISSVSLKEQSVEVKYFMSDPERQFDSFLPQEWQAWSEMCTLWSSSGFLPKLIAEST